MTQIMTPSATAVITSGQIGKIQELLGAALRKSGLPSGPTQDVLEIQGDSLAADLLAQVRKRVEAMSELIVRRVKVNRSRTPQETIKATGRNPYVDDTVVAAMPRGEGEEVDVYFFKVGHDISDAELEKQYELRGLIPADPYSQAAVNEQDPSFADDDPNGTHWQDANGNWCFAAFVRWRGGRGVSVRRCDGAWGGRWWLA